MAKKNKGYGKNANKNSYNSKDTKNNQKNNRNDSRENDKFSNDYRNRKEVSRTNDAGWYAHNPQLVKDASNIWFSTPLGADIEPKYNTSWDNFTNKFCGEKYFPGLMSFDIALTVGRSVNGTSPINTATADVYSYIRHENAGHANYDAADLMLYIMAMDTLHALHAFGMRSYGIARNFTYANRYYPNALLESANWDVEDLHRELNHLRYGLNLFAAKMNTLKVPGSLNIFKRHKWMFSGIYLDSTSLKAQTYLFNPAYGYQFTLDSDGAGMLECVWLKAINSQEPFTVQQFLTELNRLADVLINSEDMKIMSGDILKAYKDDVIMFDTIGEDYQVLPVYDPIVAAQIQNATIVGEPVLNSMNVLQRPGVTGGYTGIRCNPWIEHNTGEEAACMTANRILNSDIDSITPEMVMEMTRLTVGLSEAEVANEATIHSCGSEFITSAHICVEPNLPFEDGSYHYYSMCMDNPSVMEIAAISKFNNHPAFYMMEEGMDSESINIGLLQDVTNFAEVENSTLERLHNVALLSLYNVPQNK